MEHGSTHVCKLPKFPVGNCLDSFRPVDDPRISDQETGHIRPVLIHIGMHRLRHNGTCDIRSASGEGLDRTILLRAVKAGDHGILHLLQLRFQSGIRLVRMEVSVLIKDDNLCGIHKRKAQILCHHDTVQILSAGRRVIPARLRLELFFDLDKLLIQGKLQVKSRDDLLIAEFDLLQLRIKLFPCFRQLIALVKHIRHFGVIHMTFAGCGRNHKFSLRIRMNDICHLLKLFCARKRASAKLYYFFHNGISSMIYASSNK